MKVALAIVIAAIVIAAVVVIFLAGSAWGWHKARRSRMRRLGTDYEEAAQLIRRLAGQDDINGVLAGDVISPATRQQCVKWVNRWDKEIANR